MILTDKLLFSSWLAGFLSINKTIYRDDGDWVKCIYGDDKDIYFYD